MGGGRKVDGQLRVLAAGGKDKPPSIIVRGKSGFISIKGGGEKGTILGEKGERVKPIFGGLSHGRGK